MDITDSTAFLLGSKVLLGDFSLILLVASGRGVKEHRRERRCNRQALTVCLGPAVVEDGFQRQNSFVELLYQELNFGLLHPIGGRF